MTPEEKHAHRCAQKRRSYAKRCAEDPTYRQRQNKAQRARYIAEHGPSKRVRHSALTPEQLREHLRTLRRNRYRRRTADPAFRAGLRQREVGESRVAQKRVWRRAHAADLNARRRAARIADPQRFRAVERASKKRRRARRDS